jgi:hypothetical protein
VDKHTIGKTRGLVEADFRERAAAATGEFNQALAALAGEASNRERARLREAAKHLLKILARVLVRTE